MSAGAARPDVVRLDNVADLAVAVPHLLGYHPSDSLVAIALRGPRDRVSFTMRMDLLDEAYDDDVAREFAARMRHARAESVLVFLFVDEPPRGGELPRRPLVALLQKRLRVPLRDAALVTRDRVWSYLCDDSRCCPQDGTVIRTDSPGALALAAANALVGTAVLPDRAALMATAAPVGGLTAQSMQQAFDRVAARVDPSDVVDVASSVEFLDPLLARYRERPGMISHEEAAELALRLHAWPFRDHVLGMAARGDDVVFSVVADLVKLAQPPWDAPAVSVFAMACYFRGDGALAVTAAERAAVTDPDYSLARLVLEAVDRQVDPRHARRVWAKATRTGH